MNLTRHYRTLGLRRGATAGEVKSAYRLLVRQYHPDINPDEAAVEQFIKINDAYTILSESLQAGERKCQNTVAQVEEAIAAPSTAQNSAQSSIFAGDEFADDESGLGNRLRNIRSTLEKLGFSTFEEAGEPVVLRSVSKQTQTVQPSAKEAELKRETYEQLKELLKQQKFPRAIALIEGLAHRMPHDSEIVQWQAIVYQRWGRKLIQAGQTHKARIYLKKALRTDPNNRALWREVNRDFWQLASLGR